MPKIVNLNSTVKNTKVESKKINTEDLTMEEKIRLVQEEGDRQIEAYHQAVGEFIEKIDKIPIYKSSMEFLGLDGLDEEQLNSIVDHLIEPVFNGDAPDNDEVNIAEAFYSALRKNILKTLLNCVNNK